MKSVFVLLATIEAIAASVIPERKEFQTGLENGKDVFIKDWNFVASVFVNNKDNDWSLRTGSGIILNEKWLLTSGHCVYHHSLENLYVRVGSNWTDHDGEVKNLRAIVPYPRFNDTLPKNDLALLQFYHPLKLSKTVGIAHRIRYPPHVSDKVTVVGFGASNINDSFRLGISKQSITDFVVTKLGDVNLIHTISLESNSGPFSYYSGSPLVAGGYVVGTYSKAIVPSVKDPNINTIYSYTDITADEVWLWINKIMSEESYNA